MASVQNPGAKKAKKTSTKTGKPFYVTTPIYYINDVPHIGHAYTTIAADVLARYHRLKGDDVFFLTGTDEHGQKAQEAADKAGLPPKKFCDSMVPHFKEAWKLLNISNDHFVRTTDSYHEAAVKEIIKRCHANGDIYLGDYEGLYCSGCEAFYLEKDLIDGKCPVHKRELKVIREPSYFFKLSAYQDKLLALYHACPEFISPEFRKDEVINRVKEGLKDLSVSRTTLKWGIPFPIGEGHVVYVWFDALTNYISALGWPDEHSGRWHYWPADCHLIGKEIAWFHCVIWPAMLMSAKIPVPKQVFCHGWLTVEGQKMSKSLGNFIKPSELVQRYGVDPTRYALLHNIPFGQDGDFSEAGLIAHVNADLADAYGNLLSRILTLTEKNIGDHWPMPEALTPAEQTLADAANALSKNVDESLAALEYHVALDRIFAFVRSVNKYVNDNQPWKLTAEADKGRLATVLYTSLECIRIATHYLSPFIPATAEKAAQQLGITIKSLDNAQFSTTTKATIKKGAILQPKLFATKTEQAKAVAVKPATPLATSPKSAPSKTGATTPQPAAKTANQLVLFSKLNLKVARILEAKPHPDADKLTILHIDVGTEKRTLVAGIRKYYTPEQLVGRNIVIVANLKPAKLRGVMSQGMLLAADDGKNVVLLDAPKAKPGDSVGIKGVNAGLSEITLDDLAPITMTVKKKKVVIDGKPLTTTTGDVTCDISDGASVR
jgi:methionyl-tRNA synthetase